MEWPESAAAADNRQLTGDHHSDHDGFVAIVGQPEHMVGPLADAGAARVDARPTRCGRVNRRAAQ
jgi:hypothetical protein